MPVLVYIVHKNDTKINGEDYVGKLFTLWEARCYQMASVALFSLFTFLFNVASFIDALKMFTQWLSLSLVSTNPVVLYGIRVPILTST